MMLQILVYWYSVISQPHDPFFLLRIIELCILKFYWNGLILQEKVDDAEMYFFQIPATIPCGGVGKMLVYKSGVVKLKMGDFLFLVRILLPSTSTYNKMNEGSICIASGFGYYYFLTLVGFIATCRYLLIMTLEFNKRSWLSIQTKNSVVLQESSIMRGLL